MSLRAFHIFFVVVSILMCATVSAWGFHVYAHHGDSSALRLASACLFLGAVLVLYGFKMYRKLKELGH